MTSCNAQRLHGLGITLINYFIPMFNIIIHKLYFVSKIIVFWRVLEYNAFILFKGNLWGRRCYSNDLIWINLASYSITIKYIRRQTTRWQQRLEIVNEVKNYHSSLLFFGKKIELNATTHLVRAIQWPHMNNLS